MSKKYLITQEFKGFRNKRDITKLEDGVLVSGSQNVLSTDGENIKIREGYILDGQESTGDYTIDSSYDWNTHSGVERNLRAFTDGDPKGVIQFRYVDPSSGDVTWTDITLAASATITPTLLNYAEYWDTANGQDTLLFVDGQSRIFGWTGGVAKVNITGSTSNTLKLQDTTTTWAKQRFEVAGTFDKRLTINGTEYTYTGGESTDTLTGVSPDPTTGGHSDGDLAIQTIDSIGNASMPGIDSDYENNLIETLDNQVWIGSFDSRQILKSKVNNFKDFSFTSPRLVGEGALITLDGVPTGFIVQEENMYISAGKDQWYVSNFTLSADLVNETIIVKRLKTTAQEASQSQSMIAKIKNTIVYVSNEPTLDELGRVENVDTPQSTPISDPIKTEFNSLDFTGAHMKYFKNNLYIAIPAEGKVYIYNIERGFWEAPQRLPVRRLAIIDNELYGHGSIKDETYKLFTGTDDNGVAIQARAEFSYQNFGSRALYKNFDEFYSEGRISSNTKLNLSLKYDFGGSEGVKSFIIDGGDKNILFAPTEDGSLGKNPLGSQPIGTTTEEVSTLSKFRQIDTTTNTPFFEMQVVYETNEIDAQWEILAFGGNISQSTNQQIIIKK